MGIDHERKSLGFTMIELLVVIAIIGILSAIVLASLTDSRNQAMASRAITEMRQIRLIMEFLYEDTELYPNMHDSLCPPTSGAPHKISLLSDTSSKRAGLLSDSQNQFPNWDGPYITNVYDPWGTPYFFDKGYQCSEDVMGCGGTGLYSVLISCGPDRAVHGTGDTCKSSGPDGKDNVVYVLCRN